MTIKLIVTDMDGTFYHADLSYDKERFNQLHEKMKEQGIRFCIASGNPYSQISSFIDDDEDVIYISNNGAKTTLGSKIIDCHSLSQEQKKQLLELVDPLDLEICIIGGRNASYTSAKTDPKAVEFYRTYFPDLTVMDSLLDIEDDILTFALAAKEDNFEAYLQLLQEHVKDPLEAVHCGYYDIDLIQKGVNKGSAVAQLCQKLNIKPEEVMSFGDAMNDAEILEMAGYGFVMANGDEELKKRIGRVTAKGVEEDGILDVISEYFADPKQFLEKYKG